jgi:hypothetical protein
MNDSDSAWDAMTTSQLLYELQFTCGRVSQLLSFRQTSTRSWCDDMLRQFRRLQTITECLAVKQRSEFEEALKV